MSGKEPPQTPEKLSTGAECKGNLGSYYEDLPIPPNPNFGYFYDHALFALAQPPPSPPPLMAGPTYADVLKSVQSNNPASIVHVSRAPLMLKRRSGPVVLPRAHRPHNIEGDFSRGRMARVQGGSKAKKRGIIGPDGRESEAFNTGTVESVENSPDEKCRSGVARGATCDAKELASYFVIKSNSELNVYLAEEQGVWASTVTGNRRLQDAYSQTPGAVFLFFSVKGSKRFCGVARMKSSVDEKQRVGRLWVERERWQGTMQIEWLCDGDVRFETIRRHVPELLPNQEPVTAGRDVERLSRAQGERMLKLFGIKT